MQEIKHNQVKPVIIYLLSHHSKFLANKQVISVVLIATHMPAQYEQQTNKKLAVNGKWKTSQLTIIHEENFPMVQCKWHLIHSQVTE
jgi:hypothetical protein